MEVSLGIVLPLSSAGISLKCEPCGPPMGSARRIAEESFHEIVLVSGVVVAQRRAGAVDERVVRVGDRRRGERQRGTSADEHLVDDLAGHHLRLRCACSEGEVADERRGAQGGIHAGADVGDPQIRRARAA